MTPALTRGVQQAISQINAAGGVLGRDVELVVRDEGVDVASATAALTELIEAERVDGVIGPVSSRAAFGLIRTLSNRRIPLCSPTASAFNLDTGLDASYFFRTVPSTKLEALALGRSIASTGQRTASILYPDDEFGRLYAASLGDGLRRNGTEVAAAVPYSPASNDFKDVAARIVGNDVPDAVAVVALPETGGRLLGALRDMGAGPGRLPTFVSDAMRQPGLYASIPDGRPGSVEGIAGVSANPNAIKAAWIDTFIASTSQPPGAYAPYAYDCALLLALSVIAADTDRGSAIRDAMIATSRGGTTCTAFAMCADLLGQGLNIDYDGASGPVDLTSTGDVDSGYFDRYTFDASGRDVSADAPILIRL